jgi:hypothetical protein
MKRPQIFPLFVMALMTVWLVGCGGGGSTPPPPPPVISVSFSAAAPTSLNTAATASLTAVVSNDSSNAGVKWTATCTPATSSTCGSFSSATTASGAATTYTAPSAVPSPATVTVTATSVTDATKSASATITIAAVAPSISVTFAATPPATLATSATTSITANVANDSANAGVKWTVTCTAAASSTCGSFSAATTASGTATTYTAPSAIPSPATVTVTATSVTDTTKSASATITIGAILANGNYVYHISGEDSTGPYFIVGVIVVQNGQITAGEQDFSDRSNGYTTVFPATGSSISVVGSNVQLTLNTGNTNIGVSGIETLRGPKVSSTRVLLSEFDTFASGAGSLDLQTSTAAPSGGYAFSVGGIDGTTNGYALAIGGVLNISGTTISPTGSVLDYNDGGSVGQSVSLTSSSTVSAPDSVGRVTFTVTPNSTSLANFILTGYIIGTNRIQLVESQTDTLDADLGGTALGQGTHAGTFTPAGVANTTYVFAAPGTDSTSNGSTLNFAGSFTLGTAGALSGTIAVNDMTYYGALAITGGTYAVDPTGRVTISGITPSLTTSPFAVQLYLDGNGNAMELGDDSQTLSYGVAYQQSNATAALSGNFGMTGAGFGNVNNTAPGWSASGPATVASSGAVTGYTDYNLAGTTPVSNVALTGSLSTTITSTVNLIGINAASATTSNAYYYFSIDGKRFLGLENDGAQLGILQLETISP